MLIYRTEETTGNAAATAYSQQLVQANFTLDSSGGAAALGGVQATGNGFEVTAVSVGGALTVSVKPQG